MKFFLVTAEHGNNKMMQGTGALLKENKFFPG